MHNPFIAQLDSPIVTLYRGQETRVCHSNKEFNAAVKEGFGEYNRAEHEFPKMLHHQSEEPIVIYGPEQERSYLASGWSETPFRTYPLKEREPAPVAAVTAGMVSVQDFMSIISNLQQQIAELKAQGTPKESAKEPKKKSA